MPAEGEALRAWMRKNEQPWRRRRPLDREESLSATALRPALN